MTFKETKKTLLITFGIAISYFIISWLNWIIFRKGGLFPMPLWPAAGLAIAVVYRFGKQSIPGLYLGVLSTNFLLFNSNWVLAFIIGFMNAIGSYIAYKIIQYGTKNKEPFSNIWDFGIFVVLAIIVYPAITSIGGISGRLLVGSLNTDSVLELLESWWLTHSIGILLFSPLLLSLFFPQPDNLKRNKEYVFFAILAILSAIIIFFFTESFSSGLPNILIVPLAWIAIRHSLIRTMFLFNIIILIGIGGIMVNSGQVNGISAMFPFRIMAVAYNVVLLVISIMSRKQLLAEEAMKLRELALNSSVSAVIINDMEGNALYFNDSFLNQFGFTHEEACRIKPGDLAPSVEAIEYVMNILKKKGSFVGEVIATRKDGSLFDSIVTSSIISDNQGKPIATVGSFVDITHQKQSERALQAKTALLEAQLNATIDGILIVDENQKRILTNRRIFELFNVPKHIWEDEDDQSLLNHVVSLTKYPDKFLEKVMYLYEHNSESSRDEIEFKSGMLLDRYSAPVFGKDGNFYGRIWTFRDLTDRKRAEEEREKLHEQLSQSQKMESVGRLAGGVAHDFNNMLGVILGHTELVMEMISENDPIYSDLLSIKSAAERSSDLTKQLLAFARKQTAIPKILNLNEIIEGMIKMLSRLISENISLSWKPDPSIGNLKMDPIQINQILVNLCVNARDAIRDTGRIIIKTQSLIINNNYSIPNTVLTPGEYILLSVSDNGCGMGPEVISHLFEPFFTTKEQGKGTGLGLATIYGIITQNKGFIDVFSEPGTGTTFNIYLPVTQEKIDEQKKEITSESVKDNNSTILLVEDEQSILEMTIMMLQRKGYNVIAAKTPNEAIELAKKYNGKINLLLTDVIMPEMNGRVLAENLRKSFPSLRCLFMSGYTADVITHHGVLEKGVQFIQKPFTRKELIAKIQVSLLDN